MITQDIHNAEIVQELIENGFTVQSENEGIWTMASPADISNTKARKIVSIVVQLYVAARELGRAQSRYEGLVYRLDEINLMR